LRLSLFLGIALVACSSSPHIDRLDDTGRTETPASALSASDDGPSQTPQSAPDSTSLSGFQPAIVNRVTDGDTIQVTIDGKPYGVRYLLIDTPETVDPRAGVQCMGREASQRNKELVEGETVYLEADVTDKDRFGRLLRYVYLADGSMVNELLVLEGLAAVSTVPPDVRHVDRLLVAQRNAVEASLGLWGVCDAATITPLR
jgi:micrococcal nuclease